MGDDELGNSCMEHWVAKCGGCRASMQNLSSCVQGNRVRRIMMPIWKSASAWYVRVILRFTVVTRYNHLSSKQSACCALQ
jgi:hypothetical protein